MGLLESLKEQEKISNKLKAEIQEFKAPLQLAKEGNTHFDLEKLIKVAKESANRWTDNIFILEAYLKENFNVEMESMRNEFGIPLDLDSLL